MVSYLILCGAVVASLGGNLFSAAFNRREKEGSAILLYNLIYTATAFFGWLVIWLTQMSFDAGVLWYSLGFGVGFVMAQGGYIRALQLGPISLSALLLQFSLIITAVWGLVFWGDELTALTVVGLCLVVVSLVLCVLQKGDRAVSLKWLFFAVVSMVGNAACTILQKEQVLNYNGEHNGMLMAFALLFASIACLIIWLKAKPRCVTETVKRSGALPLVAGVFNVLMNLCVILLATRLPGSVVYPVFAVGSLALTSLLSALIFRERLSLRQWIGIGVGAVAVLLLSL